MQMIRDNSLCPLCKCKQSLLRDRGCWVQSRQWPQIQRGLLEKYKRSCSRNTNTKGLAREIRKELLEKYKYKGACSRNTKGVAREIQIQIQKHVHTSANPEIQNN